MHRGQFANSPDRKSSSADRSALRRARLQWRAVSAPPAPDRSLPPGSRHMLRRSALSPRASSRRGGGAVFRRVGPSLAGRLIWTTLWATGVCRSLRSTAGRTREDVSADFVLFRCGANATGATRPMPARAGNNLRYLHLVPRLTVEDSLTHVRD